MKLLSVQSRNAETGVFALVLRTLLCSWATGWMEEERMSCHQKENQSSRSKSKISSDPRFFEFRASSRELMEINIGKKFWSQTVTRHKVQKHCN
jgi:hypothetical protein